jgi:CHAT domain-containing protein
VVQQVRRHQAKPRVVQSWRFPLGLSAGLLCADAALAIQASWLVQSRTGGDFLDHFYTEIREATEDIRDIAVALQKAVLNVKDENWTSGRMSWEAFTIYGS